MLNWSVRPRARAFRYNEIKPCDAGRFCTGAERLPVSSARGESGGVEEQLAVSVRQGPRSRSVQRQPDWTGVIQLTHFLSLAGQQLYQLLRPARLKQDC